MEPMSDIVVLAGDPLHFSIVTYTHLKFVWGVGRGCFCCLLLFLKGIHQDL